MSQLRKPFRVLALVRRYDERSAAACDGIRDHVREHDLEWELQVVSQAESAKIERERRPWAPVERLVADGVIALMCGKLVPEFKLPEKTRSAARVQVVGGTVYAAYTRRFFFANTYKDGAGGSREPRSHGGVDLLAEGRIFKDEQGKDWAVMATSNPGAAEEHWEVDCVRRVT